MTAALLNNELALVVRHSKTTQVMCWDRGRCGVPNRCFLSVGVLDPPAMSAKRENDWRTIFESLRAYGALRARRPRPQQIT